MFLDYKVATRDEHGRIVHDWGRRDAEEHTQELTHLSNILQLHLVATFRLLGPDAATHPEASPRRTELLLAQFSHRQAGSRCYLEPTKGPTELGGRLRHRTVDVKVMLCFVGVIGGARWRPEFDFGEGLE